MELKNWNTYKKNTSCILYREGAKKVGSARALDVIPQSATRNDICVKRKKNIDRKLCSCSSFLAPGSFQISLYSLHFGKSYQTLESN